MGSIQFIELHLEVFRHTAVRADERDADADEGQQQE